MPGPDGLTLDFSEFNRQLRALSERNAVEAGLMTWQVGQAILGAAQKRTPVDTTALQNSALSDPKDAGPLNYQIGFNTEYAAAVHERLELTHSQGQAKFLEAAIREEGPEILRRQAAEFARRLGVN